MALKSFSSGSNGAIQSALRPATMMTSTIARPMAPSGLRRQKLSARRKGVRLRNSISSLSTSGLGAMTVTVGPSREADAWIEPGIQHVDHEVGDDEDGDDQHDQGLGQDVVLVLHRL